MAAHTPGRNVKKLYFWLLMTFRGYRWSLFSGCPNQTVRGLGSPPPQHLSHSQHLWERQTHKIKTTPMLSKATPLLSKATPLLSRPHPQHQDHARTSKSCPHHQGHAHKCPCYTKCPNLHHQGHTHTIKATPTIVCSPPHNAFL